MGIIGSIIIGCLAGFCAEIIMGIIGSIIIGCLAGFCAGKLMKGGGMGFHHSSRSKYNM